jgi:hypothetical protein
MFKTTFENENHGLTWAWHHDHVAIDEEKASE